MAMFGWCMSGNHKECIREYEIFYFDPANKRKKTTGMVMTGETQHCQCDKRGCPCFVKKADRDKKVKKRKK